MRTILSLRWLGPVLATALVAGGCGHGGTPRSGTDVVAAFYPAAYAAQRVGGRAVHVINLTPAGAEPHDLELTTKQRDQVQDATVVIVTGHSFQPAVEKAAKTRDGATVTLLGAKQTRDPHIWLDPVLMTGLVHRVADALVKAAPQHRRTFLRNERSLIDELDQLDARYRDGLAHCDRKLIVTSHEAFGYLARRYGLQQQGVAGLSPDSEPNPQRLAELSDLAKEKSVTTIFTEELVSPRIANTLAREAGGLKTAVLNPLEGLTDREVANGANYVTVMDANLRKLQKALGCN